MRALTAIAVFGLAVGTSRGTHGVEPDPVPTYFRSVLRLSPQNCVSGQNSVLSGFLFRSAGQLGVLTALHGVAGCEPIRARGFDGLYLDDLTIRAVDLDRDVAWLESKELGALPSVPNPFPIASGVPDKLTVVGYPQGVSAPLEHPVNPQTRRLAPLGELVPQGSAVRSGLEQRRSPKLDFVVLSLTGALQPGHSGGAILDASKQLVAIGDGGLNDGNSQIGWAIPISAIDLKPLASLRSEVASLGLKPRLSAFALQDAPTGIPGVTPLQARTVAIEADLKALTSETCARASEGQLATLKCEFARRQLENERNRMVTVRRVALLLLDVFSPARWSQSEEDWSSRSSDIRQFYLQQVEQSQIVLLQLQELAIGSNNEELAKAAILTRTGVQEAFDPLRFTADPTFCSHLPPPADPACIPTDWSVQRARFVLARRAVRQLVISLDEELGSML